jgi:hypothetical protein
VVVVAKNVEPEMRVLIVSVMLCTT